MRKKDMISLFFIAVNNFNSYKRYLEASHKEEDEYKREYLLQETDRYFVSFIEDNNIIYSFGLDEAFKSYLKENNESSCLELKETWV